MSRGIVQVQPSSTSLGQKKITDKMADKTFKKNKTKETTDPNLNDLEINDNSAKDDLITITRIDCINGNFGNKETQTKKITVICFNRVVRYILQ